MTRIPKGLAHAVLLAALAAAGNAMAGGIGLDLAERDSHFRAHETATRTVIVTNTGEASATVRLNWRLAAPPALVEAGAATLIVPPRESARLPLRLRLPAARRPVDLQLAVQAATDREPPLLLQAGVRVYPVRQDLPWAFLARQRIGVYDPRGRLLARLHELGGKPRVLVSLAQARDFTGDLLLLGESSLRNPAAWDSFRESLEWRTVQTPLLVLAQPWSYLDAAAQAWGEGLDETDEDAWAAALRPIDFSHPLLRLLDPRDLVGWRDPPVAGRAPWRSPTAGNLCLFAPAELRWTAQAGAARGAALLEEDPQAGGRLILCCQIPLLERWDAEPASEILLNAMMRYALAGGWPPRQ